MQPMTVAPNQIQLEVQVNQQLNTNEPESPEQDLPAPSPPEIEEEPETEPAPPAEEKNTCLALMAFIVILILFVWPFLLTFLNYYTDYTLFNFIKATRDEYNAAHSQIEASNHNLSTLTCSFNGENSLSAFQDFVSSSTNQTLCTCVDLVWPNIDCAALRDAQWTTSNFDYDTCTQYEADTTSKCVRCSGCHADSVYHRASPQHLYAVQLYESYDGEGREKFCSPEKMRTAVFHDTLDTQFAACYYSCIVFFAITGIWILCGLCAGCKVRYRDLYRSYLWCFKGEKPKKRGKYHPDNTINKDEFTLFVVSVIFLHVFEDVVQCIIAMVFSIYKQANGGSDCIEDWAATSYADSVQLVPYTGGLSIGEIMGRDDVVETFFVFSFLSVFFSGLYAIRLFSFDMQQVLLYPWWKNMLFLIVGILLGCFFILLVLSPFWGAVWMSGDALYLTKNESAFLMWTFIVGMCGYVVAICMPLCFADQLDCDCACGDGCC